MANKKTDALSLSVKNGDSSVLDLFMKSPDNIKDFTNWEDKTASLEVDRATGLPRTAFELPTDPLPKYDNVEIKDDIAIASLPDFDSVQITDRTEITRVYRVSTFKQEVPTYGDDMIEGEMLNDGFFIPISTTAGKSMMHLDALQQQGVAVHPSQLAGDVSRRELKYFVRYQHPTDPTKVVVGGHVGAGVFTSSSQLVDIDPDRFKTLLDSKLDIDSLQENFAAAILEPGTFPSYAQGTTYEDCDGETGIPNRIGGGITVFAKGQLQIGGVTSRSSNRNDIGLFAIDFHTVTPDFDADKDWVIDEDMGSFTYRAKDPSGKLWKYTVTLNSYSVEGIICDKRTNFGAGRVDHFMRMGGNISSANASDNTVNLSSQVRGSSITSFTGQGLIDGDLIKITSVLQENPNDSINSLNGLYYVKKISSSFALYYDPNLKEQVDISGFRDITTAQWALMKSVNGPPTPASYWVDDTTARWVYTGSTVGLNKSEENAAFNHNENYGGIISKNTGWAGVGLASRTIPQGNPGAERVNELVLKNNNFNLGKSISISDSGLVAFSQPGNHFNVNGTSLKFYASFDQPEPTHYPDGLGFMMSSLSIRRDIGGNIIGEDGSPKPLVAKRDVVCEPDDVQEGSTTEQDDNTGITYGEGGIFDTPMGEPVVVDPSADFATLTGPDNVEYFDYTDDSMFEGDEDSASGGPDVTQVRDAKFKFSYPYVGGEVMPHGCVFVHNGSEKIVVTAETGNEFISNQPTSLLGYTNLYWHKIHAHYLNDPRINTLMFGNSNYGIPDGGVFGQFNMSGGDAEYNIYDLITRPGVSTLWNTGLNSQAAAYIRPYYLANFDRVRGYTDGFGAAITFGDENRLYVADQVNNLGTSYSLYTDLLLFDYDYIEQNENNPKYQAIGDPTNFGLADGEKVTTKKQANIALQDFANANTKNLAESIPTLTGYKNYTFSIHVKKILGTESFRVTNDETVAKTIQLIPYEADTANRAMKIGDSSLRYNSPIMQNSDSKIFITEGSKLGGNARIKALSRTETESFGLKRSRIIAFNADIGVRFYNTQGYETLEDALKDPRIWPEGGSLWGGHQYMFKESGNIFATNTTDSGFPYNAKPYDKNLTPLYKTSPFTLDLITGFVADGYVGNESVWENVFYLNYKIDPRRQTFPRIGSSLNYNVGSVSVPTTLDEMIPSTEAISTLVDQNVNSHRGHVGLLNDSGGNDIVLQHHVFTEDFIADPNPEEHANTLGLGRTFTDFRCNDGILAFLAKSSMDEFGLSAPEAVRLYIYDISGNKPKFLQIVTAALPGHPGSRNHRENKPARMSLDESTLDTSGIYDFGGVDIAGGKIFTSIIMPVTESNSEEKTRTVRLDKAYAIFSDTGRTPLPRSVPLGNFTEPLFPFFSFVEDFSDSSPYNLNDVFQYIRNEGSFTSSTAYDINNSHRSPVLFFSVRSFSRDGQALAMPVDVSFNVIVDNNTTSSFRDGTTLVLPKIGIYNQDPRLSIEQKGEIVGDKLLFGDDASSPSIALYQNGAQGSESFVTVLEGNYRFSGGQHRAKVSLDLENNADAFIEYKPLSSEDNRTFRYNDGTGKTLSSELDAYENRIPATYQLEFDDINKESYNRSFYKGGKVLAASLLSWDAFFREYSLPYNKLDSNEENPHAYINSAKLSATVQYKEYDLGVIRKFACDGNWYLLPQPDPNDIRNALFDGPEFGKFDDLELVQVNSTQGDGVLERGNYVDGGDLVRAGVSQSQPQLNKSAEILLGTESHSVQIVARELAFDIPKPDFLPLMISSIPSEENNFDLSTTGHVAVTGSADLHISGVFFHDNAMTIHLGEVLKNAGMDVSMPDVIGFECDGVALSLLPPTGTHVENDMSLTFPGGTGVSEGLSFSLNPTYTSGGFDFYVAGGLASGNMDVSMSGVHGVVGSMPCVEGNLYMGGMTGTGNGALSLQISRFTHSGDMSLFVDTTNTSGIIPLALNVETPRASGTLFSAGKEDFSSDTTLYIGRQFEEKRTDLSVSGPIAFEGDPITLHASGAAVNSVDSNDYNFDYMCHLTRTEDIFDFSSQAEQVVDATKSNSISRNTHLPSSQFKYGYYSPFEVGKQLSSFTGDSAARFYDTELSREAIGSNENYLAVGTNVSKLSSNVTGLHIFEYLDGESVNLKFTYDRFFIDMNDLGLLTTGDTGFSLRYKSVEVSENNRIAVSIRFRTDNGLRDAVCILQPGSYTRTRYGTVEFDLCAIEPSYTIPVSTERIDGWIMTHAILGDFINENDSLVKTDNYLGSTVQWKNEDVYYDRQSKNYGRVHYVAYSEDYANEHLAFTFNSTNDGQQYYENRNNLPAGTKVGFGSRFKIHGDYAVVSAPLFDSFIAGNKLSVTHAPSPEGSAYVYRFDSSWNYVDAIYSGGYTSANIAGVSDCYYNNALFGYSVDVDKDSGFVVASEPVTNKIYKYVIHGNDTVSLVSEYTDSTSVGFGKKVNICTNSILTSTVQSIKEPVFGHEFQFTPQENIAEVQQYNQSNSKTKSVSTAFTFVLDIAPKGAKRLLVGRLFKANFVSQDTVTIEKFSILRRGNYGNLFIQGPSPSTFDVDVSYYRPFEVENNNMALQFASIGVNSGIPLHVHVPNPATGIIPLHLRQAEKAETTLFISHNFTPVSGFANLSTFGPATHNSSGDLYIDGAAGENRKIETFIFGNPEGVEMSQFARNMFVKQDDPISVVGDIDLSLHGVVNTASGHFAAGEAFVEGGLYAPASKAMDFLYIQTDLSGSVSGISTLAVAVDPAAGPASTGIAVSVSGVGTSAAEIARGNHDLVIAATAPNSGVATLAMNRKGIGGGEELAADRSLIVYNLTESSNVDLAVSGANITIADMNIAISGVVGAPTGIIPTFIKGYQD